MASINDTAVSNFIRLTGDGGVGVEAVQLYFQTRDEAKAYMATALEPSLILTRGEETGLVYALDQIVQTSAFPITTAYGFTVPGEDHWDFATDEHETACAENSFRRYSPEQLAFVNEIHLEHFDDIVDDDVPFFDAAKPASEDEKPQETPAGSPEPVQLNDALVHGNPDPAILERPIQYGFAADGIAADYKNGQGWATQEQTIGALLIGGLSRHPVGQKKGSAILQGDLIDRNTRKKHGVRSMHLIGLDVDNGTEIAPVVDRIKRLGLMASVYTTHSHMGTRTEIKLDSYAQWTKKNGLEPHATDEAMARYFVEARGCVPEIARTVHCGQMEHTSDGMVIPVDHAPIPKFRIILPLAEPFVFADIVQRVTGSPQEALKLWARKYLGMARMLDVEVDGSCVDPSRLLYLPRHEQGREFEIHIVAGELVSIDEIEEVEPRKKLDLFSAVADEMGAGGYTGNLMTREGVSLTKWNRERGEGFEITAVFENHCSEKLRGSADGVKHTVECPFDHSHSNAGDEEDGGAFLANASDNAASGHEGFAFRCMHASCADKGKLDLLAEALRLGWFGEDVLFDEDYMSVEFDAEQAQAEEDNQDAGVNREETLRAVRQHIQSFTPQTSGPDIEAAIRTALEVRINPFQLENLKDEIVAKTKSKKSVIDNTIKGLKHEIRRSMNEADYIEQYKLQPRPGTAAVVIDLLDDYQLIERSKTLLALGNKNTPRLFKYSNDRWRCLLGASKDLVLEKVSEDILASETIRYATYFSLEAETGKAVLPPKRIMSMLHVDPEIALPKLEGFARMPYVSRSGALVRDPGYNAETGFMLHLPSDFTIPEIPEAPNLQQVDDAKELLLRHIFGDFPFDDGHGRGGTASLAHLLCMMLEPSVRPMITGATPGYYVQKPMAGTGGTLLVKTALRIATGAENPSSTTESHSEEERRKAITASLIQGRSHFWLDNVARTLDSPAYANLLTAVTWEDRELGSSKTVELPNRATKVFSGNNMRFSHELTRRGVLIRIDAKRDPLARTDFRISDLDNYVVENRGALAAAVLTLVRFWISQGMPRRTAGRKLASFESWCEVMGGILDCIGVPGFLNNIDVLQDGANDENAAWTAFVGQWYARDDWHIPSTIADPELKPESIASILWQNEDAPEVPGVYGRSSNQFAGNLRKALKFKADNVFEIEDNDGSKISVAIRRGRSSRGSDEFHLERVED